MSEEIPQQTPQQRTRGVYYQNKDVLQTAVSAGGQVAKRAFGELGADSYEGETRTGKGLLITWWILIAAIFIYMIVLAIIYYNDYTKWQYNETSKKWLWNTGKKDAEGKDIYEEREELTEDEIITWNIHKTVMNGLLAFMSIFGIIIFVFGGVGSVTREGEDICGSNQLGLICFVDMIWFIVNMVWDIKHSQYTKTEQTTNSGPEKFCGMMETFCGSVSEGFSNVAKKLRKF